MKKTALKLLAALSLPVAAFLTFPLEVDGLRRKALLRLSGARETALGRLTGYERDRCEGGRPCRCVALIHGLGDTALTWDKLLKTAPPDAVLVAPHLPGTEGSPPPPSWGVRAQGRFIAEALSTRCSKWTLVGNSLGGWISAWIALDRPELVSDLVLLDAAGVEDPSGMAVETAKFLANPTGEGLRVFDGKARHETRVVPRRILDQVAEHIKSRHTAEIVAALSYEDLLDKRLKALRIPVLIVWGLSDKLTPPDMGRRYQKLIKGSRLELIEKCGHLPQQECPEKTLSALGWTGR